MIAHATLDLGSRQLNERLEKITLRRSGSNHVPQFLEYLMAFPPKAKIQEIDAIAILLGVVPPVLWESGIPLEFFWQTTILSSFRDAVYVRGYTRTVEEVDRNSAADEEAVPCQSPWQPFRQELWKTARSCRRIAVSLLPHTHPLSKARILSAKWRPRAAQCPQTMVAVWLCRPGI